MLFCLLALLLILFAIKFLTFGAVLLANCITESVCDAVSQIKLYKIPVSCIHHQENSRMIFFFNPLPHHTHTYYSSPLSDQS